MRLILLLPFTYLPVLIVADTKIHVETGCDNVNGKSANLYTDIQFIIGKNRMNNRIEAVIPNVPQFEAKITGDFSTTVKDNDIMEQLSHRKLDWTFVFAVTFRDNNGNDIGEDFFEYGYDPKHMHNTVKKSNPPSKDQFADVNQKFNVHPFRITRIYMKSDNQQVPHLDLKADCNHDNSRAWIGQPGIFRLVISKNHPNDFVFEPIYYWPKPKQIFT